MNNLSLNFTFQKFDSKDVSLYVLYYRLFPMSNSKIDTVKKYVALRAQGKNAVDSLMELFNSNTKVTDAHGKEHYGSDAVRAYLVQPTPTPTPKGDPTLLSDGRVLYEFTVYQLFMTWPIKAYFTMDGDQISHIKLEK